MTDWADIKHRRLGGPWEADDIGWFGFIPNGVSRTVDENGLAAAFSGYAMTGLATVDDLRRFGAVNVATLSGPSFTQLFFDFRWIERDGVFYPHHWFDLGLDRCAALCRIFGPNETLWPEVRDEAA